MKESGNRSPLIVQTFHTGDLDDLFQNLFRTAVTSHDLRYIKEEEWQSEKAFEASLAGEHLRPEDEVLADMRDDCDLRLTFKRGESLIQLFACAKFRMVRIWVAGHDRDTLDAIIQAHTAVFEPVSGASEPHQANVEVGFWYLGQKGPEREEKKLDVPTWEELRGNYSQRTSEGIDDFLANFKPAAGGRLLLWHGEPGTGKTFAIRALAWEMREWCRLEYVLDPENLFGTRADYLARMIIDGSESAPAGGAPGWRMLVLEDTGELLSIDAKERAGQGLSRLLNAVDGLLGQGSRVLLLITTNEELGALHPAVTRPGRCASQVEFLPLSAKEAQNWLNDRSERDDVVEPKGSTTIAELYAMLEGRAVRGPERSRIGFVQR